ncbi:MAG TPA: amidohydrolase family protein [Candidatus Tectomicrobia bacterium]|nr:amidohydrolase family protein [Candidatus Tectomicrobia bacterium]
MIATPWGHLTLIDAHTHFFSYHFFETFARLARQNLPTDVPLTAVAHRLGVEIPPEDATALGQRWVGEMDKYGIDRLVMFTSVPGDHSSVAAAVKAFPERIIGYIMLDPTQPNAATILREAVEHQGLKGVTLFPAMHHFHAYDERVYPVYQAAGELRVPVFVHFGVLKVSIRDKLGLPNIFDLRYSDPIDLHKAAIDFADVNFIIPHFGCGYFREALMLGAQAPNVYVDTSSSNAWLTYMPSHLDLKTVFEKTLEVFGPRRTLFGTDSNVFPRGWRQDIFRHQVEILRELNTTQEAAELILGGNILRLLGLS